ncbi:zinc finger, C2H2 type [Ancylostoma caninum]|uniref:Zinc finger, C2H2 type n=1 Tax=Ancylostoma caninum TaxID=29170 RepID=A0A368HA27_ANCCA|nr:zinc finger, C2H2 type [Ancylostoma caninum]
MLSHDVDEDQMDQSIMDDTMLDQSIDSIEDLKPGYQCRFCPTRFDERQQLNVHYTTNHRDKPQYECDVCHTIFAVKRELSTHMRTHSGEQPHTCTQCGKEFGTRQLLKKHWMWHTGERSHVCKHCNKAFFQKGHLTQHLMIHSGGRPHQCNLCQKTFIFKFDLNRHMKIHAERGYSCRQCGRSFTRQQSLDEHALKCKAKSSGMATPPMKIEQPSPVFPLITQPLLNFNQENVAKMAQSLIAQQQQRTLAALLARQQAAQLPVQPAAAPPPPTPSIMPSLFCALCSKAFPNQPSFAVHMYMCHIQGNNVPVIGEETKMPILAPVNPIRTDQEDAHINVLSSTATNSSCSSSPQETTSTAFTATSPSTTEEVGASPLNESSLHSPPTAQNEIQTKPCTSCRLHAVRSSELEAALLAKGHELEKFKEMMRAVVTTTGQLLNQCSPDNVFIAHTKNIFAQLQNSICSSE